MENNNEFKNIPDLPERLADELRAQYTPSKPLPEEVDCAVLAGARSHFAQAATRRPLFWRRLAYLSAAAVLIFAFIIFSNSGSKTSYSLYDINQSGSVDILDAVKLAIYIRDDGGYDHRLDFDNNNILDRTDVNLIAYKVVELNDLDNEAAVRLNAQLAMIHF